MGIFPYVSWYLHKFLYFVWGVISHFLVDSCTLFKHTFGSWERFPQCSYSCLCGYRQIWLKLKHKMTTKGKPCTNFEGSTTVYNTLLAILMYAESYHIRHVILQLYITYRQIPIRVVFPSMHAVHWIALYGVSTDYTNRPICTQTTDMILGILPRKICHNLLSIFVSAYHICNSIKRITCTCLSYLEKYRNSFAFFGAMGSFH